MRASRTSSVLSVMLVVAHSAAAISPFPRVHSRAQVVRDGSTHAIESRAADDVIVRALKSAISSSASSNTDSHVDSDDAIRRDGDWKHRSEFSLRSPKSILARRIFSGAALERRADPSLTNGYGSLPELTDPNAIIDYTLSGYGKDGKTLSNGYGAVPASLGSIGLGKRNDFTDTFLNPVEAAVPASGSNTQLLSGTAMNAVSGSGTGDIMDASSGSPVLGLASGSPASDPVRLASNSESSAAASSSSSTAAGRAAAVSKADTSSTAEVKKPKTVNLSSSADKAQDGIDKACSFQQQQCCGQVLTSDDLAGRTVLQGLLGLDTSGLVGLQCQPIVRDVVGLYTCKGTPMCCNGNSTFYDGALALGCSNII